MDIVAYVCLTIILCYLLVHVADFVEDAFVLVAHKLHVNTFVIGFVILSLTSSIPEMSLAVSAAVNQNSGLSIGNLIGATIVLITLVTGLHLVHHKKILFQGKLGAGQVLISLLILSFQVVAIADGLLGAAEGALLLCSYLILIAYITWHASTHKHLHPNHQQRPKHIGHLGGLLLRSTVGLGGILVISNLIVQVAVHTAELLNVAPAVIGLLILGIGTNLPEIVITLRSTNPDMERLAVGNLLGSASVNTAILGVLGILAPSEITNLAAMLPSLAFLTAAIVLFGLFVWSHSEVSRREGALLLGLYLLFVVLETAKVLSVHF